MSVTSNTEPDGRFLLLTDLEVPSGELLAGDKKIWERVDPTIVRDNMAKALRSFMGALPDESDTPGFKLNEIEVAVAIGAGGEVGFLGTGVSLNCSATLTLHLVRPDQGQVEDGNSPP
ncbi:MAG TPA: hypothetical protein VGG38_02040 [Acidimicrobiales bacterium]|jgi:hypothetical protein